jgi:hypothetical protein
MLRRASIAATDACHFSVVDLSYADRAFSLQWIAAPAKSDSRAGDDVRRACAFHTEFVQVSVWGVQRDTRTHASTSE